MPPRSKCAVLFAACVLSFAACGGDSQQGASTSPPAATTAPAAEASGAKAKSKGKGKGKAKAKGKGKRKAKGKVAVPRLEGNQVRVTTRVVPDVAAKGGDSAGQQKACRMQFVVGTDGVPGSIVPVDCDAAYVDAVTESARAWRFALADGSPFESKVRIVREIQFILK